MKRWRTYLFAGCCAVVLGACTGNFRDLNDDKSGITDKELEADDNGLGYRLGIVQQGVYFNYDYGKGKNWPFQMIQNLNADMFSGYMHDPKPLQGGSHNSDYNLQDGWNGSMWQFTYSYIMPEIYRLEQTAPEQKPAQPLPNKFRPEKQPVKPETPVKSKPERKPEKPPAKKPEAADST